MTDKILVLSNCASEDEAHKVAHALVNARVAACVNIIPGVRSIYHWQGKVEDDQEWTLLIKSKRSLFPALKLELQKVHSYQVPEVIAIQIVEGSNDYLDWIDRELKESDPGSA